MKKAILMALIGCMASLQIFAQNETYRSVGSASVGISLTDRLLNLIETDASFGSISVKNIPTLQVTYDYGIKNFFSIGIATGYQQFEFEVTDFTYTNNKEIKVTKSFNADYTRLNIAVRPLFHYVNNDRMDLYSGFRIGIVNNSYSTDAINENFKLNGLDNLTRLSFGFTAFGLRYYFTENIGAGFEINLGAPYISALNVNARF